MNSKPQVIALLQESTDLEMFAPSLEIADLFEVRVDLFSSDFDFAPYLKLLKQKFHKPILWTIRLSCDGGQWPTEKALERAELWEFAFQNEVDWIDAEGDQPLAVSTVLQIRAHYPQSKTKVLCSCHDFKQSGQLEELQKRHQEMLSTGADAIKMALMPQSEADRMALETWLLQKPNKVIACFGMGQIGQRTRFTAPLLNIPWTYGCLGRPMAPGQIPVAILRKNFDRWSTNQASTLQTLDDLDLFLRNNPILYEF